MIQSYVFIKGIRFKPPIDLKSLNDPIVQLPIENKIDYTLKTLRWNVTYLSIIQSHKSWFSINRF